MPQSGFVEVNGGRLAYDRIGTGPAVVLLHAGVANRHMWDGQIAALAQDHTVIVYDARGYGGSSPADAPFQPYEDVRELLDALGIDRAALIGCSMGGGFAIDFALVYPERVTALIPVCAALGGFSGPDEDVRDLRAGLLDAYGRGDVEMAAEIWARMWFDGPRRAPEQTDQALRAQVKAVMKEVLAGPDSGEFEQWLEPPAVERLGDITPPTLVLVGEYDVLGIHAAAARMAAEIPGARLVEIPNSAHLPNLEHSALFNRLVREFLSGG